MAHYFNNCNTADECKTRYKELAKKLHPDIGGDTDEFQRMQAEYEQRLNELLNTKVNSSKPLGLREYAALAQALADLIKVKNPALHSKLGMLAMGASFIAGSIPQAKGNTTVQSIKDLLDNLRF